MCYMGSTKNGRIKRPDIRSDLCGDHFHLPGLPQLIETAATHCDAQAQLSSFKLSDPHADPSKIRRADSSKSPRRDVAKSGTFRTARPRHMLKLQNKQLCCIRDVIIDTDQATGKALVADWIKSPQLPLRLSRMLGTSVLLRTNSQNQTEKT